MRWFFLVSFGAVWLAVGSGYASEPDGDAKPGEAETVVIPLDQIWGYNVPSTKSIEKHLVPTTNGPTLEAIYRSLQPDFQRKTVPSGFAVTGNVDSVIEQMNQVLVEGENPKLRFQSDSKMSLVFYAYPSSFYVYLKEVRRKGTEIRIRYQFVFHESGDSTAHLAMISFGKLSPGKYNVRIEQVPMEKRFTEAGITSPDVKASKRLISQPFSFVVTQ